MENSQATHKIDDLSRILIPKELRNALSWNIGESIQMSIIQENGIATLQLSKNCTEQ